MLDPQREALLQLLLRNGPKGKIRENFPVASCFLARRFRHRILSLYRLARFTDDIADNPELSPEERLSILQEVESILLNAHMNSAPEWLKPYVNLVKNGTADVRHAIALISAFKQDITQKRYDSWEQSKAYCEQSAIPAGREVLRLCEEWHADLRASDALCSALQMLDHIQDMREDFIKRDHVYFPSNWFENVSELMGSRLSERAQKHVDIALDDIDNWLERAKSLPDTISDKGLRRQVYATIYAADILSRKLRQRDSLAKKIRLTRREKFLAAFKAATNTAFSRPPSFFSDTHKKRLRSSFFLPLRHIKAKDKKQAMMALYDFCRVVDDGVDHAETHEQARTHLAFWKKEISLIFDSIQKNTDYHFTPGHPVSRRLVPIAKRFGLHKEYFEDILAGQAMDVGGEMLRPTEERLDTYCYRVASSVGLIAIDILGYRHPDTPQFAIHLGKAMQLVNILRDVHEDAAKGRIYLPQETLARYGLEGISPEQLRVLAVEKSDTLVSTYNTVGAIAEQHFKQAEAYLDDIDRDVMQIALMMKSIYQTYLKRFYDKNWENHPHEAKIKWRDRAALLFFPARLVKER